MATKINTPSTTPEKEILALHESATKLWSSIRQKKDKEDVGKRIASLLIGTLVIADLLKIEDIDDILQKRMREIEKIEGDK